MAFGNGWQALGYAITCSNYTNTGDDGAATVHTACDSVGAAYNFPQPAACTLMRCDGSREQE